MTKKKYKKTKPVNSKIYDRNYFLKHCCGATEFNQSHAKSLPKRLLRCQQVANFKKGQTILDVGCGRGELAYRAAKKGCIIIAIDYSTQAIKITRRLISKLPAAERKNISVLKMDAKHLSFPKKFFDTIIMTDVIEHLHPWEVEIVINKCHTLLKNKGVLLINTSPNIWFLRYGYPIIRLLTIFKTRKDPGQFIECIGEVHVFEQTPLSLKKALKKFKTKIWGENFTKSSWINKIPLLNLFATSLFAKAIKTNG